MGKLTAVLIGDNFVKVRDLDRSKKRHNDKIKEIGNRKPFSSVTLDNSSPTTLENQGLLYLNRKREATKKFLHNMTERDNKYLIQKIGLILTAPCETNPENRCQQNNGTSKGRCKSPRTHREEVKTSSENRMINSRLKTLQPIYHAKVWEEDYRKQLQDQDRMRTVKYRRPEGFQDRFMAPQTDKLRDEDSDSFTAGALSQFSNMSRCSGSNSSRLSRVKKYLKDREKGASMRSTNSTLAPLPPLSPLSPNDIDASHSIPAVRKFLTDSDNPNTKSSIERSASDQSMASRINGPGSPGIFQCGMRSVDWKNDSKRGAQNSVEKLEHSIENGRVPIGSQISAYSESRDNIRVNSRGKGSTSPLEGRPVDFMSMRLSNDNKHYYTGDDDDGEDNIPMGFMNEDSMTGCNSDYRTAVRADLATVDRSIRIYNIDLEDATAEYVHLDDMCAFPFPMQPLVGESTCCYTPRQSECRSFYTAHARLHCWVLAQRKTLLIRAELPDSFPVIEVEAEVSVRDLALARGLDVDCLLIDPELERIAREIIDQAELTVEDKELSRQGYAKANDALDASYLKQKNGQVVRIVVHMRKWGQSAKKHHSTSEAFIDAITEGMQTAGGNATPKTSPSPPCSVIELAKNMLITVTHTVPSRAVQMMAWKTVAPVTIKRRDSLKEPASLSIASPATYAYTYTTASSSSGSGTLQSSSTSSNTSCSNMSLTDASRDTSSTSSLSSSSSSSSSSSLSSSIKELLLPAFDPPIPTSSSTTSSTALSLPTPRTALKTPRSQAPVVQIRAPLTRPTKEKIKAVVTIATCGDESDMAIVSIRFLEDSKDNQLNRVAVLAGTTVSLSTGLPSIMQADMDPELTLEFFGNLLKGLSVEHDSNTKVNSCMIEMRT